MKRVSLLPIVIGLSLLLSSCSSHLGLSGLLGKGTNSSGTPAAKTVKATHTPPSNVSGITISKGKFHPKNVEVKVGTTLTWTNNDSTQQSVTSDSPGIFDSGALAPDATFTYTFSQAGLFPYHSTGTSGGYGSVKVNP
jgi:plastocyanin